MVIEDFEKDIVWEHLNGHVSPKATYSIEGLSTRVDIQVHCMRTTRRTRNLGRVGRMRRKIVSCLPSYTKISPHPLSLEKYAGNSCIDRCYDGTRREWSDDNNPLSTIT